MAPHNLRARVARPALLAAAGIGAFTLIGALLTAYRYLEDRASGDTGTGLARLVDGFTGAYAALPLLAVCAVVVWRYPPTRATWPRRLPLYAVLLVGYSLAHTGLMAWSRGWAYPLAGLGPSSYRFEQTRLLQEGANDLVYLALILGLVAVSRRYADRAGAVRRAAELERGLADATLHNLRLQLQPHFLFNTLTAVSEVMYDDPRTADAMLGHLATLLRQSLATVERTTHEHALDEELALVEAYAALVRARFGERFRLVVDVPADVRVGAVPSLLLQPLVENAVRHGGLARIGCVEEGDRARLLPAEELLRLEADRNYVVLHAATGRFRIRGTLVEGSSPTPPGSSPRRGDSSAAVRSWLHPAPGAPMPRLRTRALLVPAVLAVGAVSVIPEASRVPEIPAEEWPAYGRDAGASRYAPLAELTPANVGRLQVAWTFHTGETEPSITSGRPPMLEATPIVVDGTMYLSTPQGRIIPATIDAHLLALDAATGRPCAGFGTDGRVDLRTGLRNAPDWTSEYEETSPPAVVGGVIVVGSAIADNSRTESASGEVRGFDARSGRLLWTWDAVTQDSTDPAYATWIGPRAHRTGAANAWSVITADSARGLVFVPTGSPSVDYFGGARLGDNRYANSVVALRAATGALVWHFQTVHHDLWDYDNPAAPLLTAIDVGGKRRDVVVQVTKQGMLFVLDRETGRPVHGVEERPVPASDVPGERAAPTQPFTTTIAPLVPHRLAADEAWGPTPEDREACRTRIAVLRHEGIYTPPSERGTLVVPGNIGGAHWGGVAVDPVRQIAVVPVNRLAASIRLIPRAGWHREPSSDRVEFTDMRGTPYVLRRELLRGPSGLPCTPPPFGELVAVDLRTGRHAWHVPLGTVEALAGKPVPAEWGSPNLGGPITTAGGLTFMAGTLDRSIRAFETATGRELWRGSLPAGGKATPMTGRTRSGRQLVVIAAGGDGGVFGRSDAIVAFALPR